ncbi:MAG TPA: DUF3090 family protein [Candidatus Micrarchaeia archaeon]|nr:DUF3090 family protein [Candidatus Micrarchaeia archaeon]
MPLHEYDFDPVDALTVGVAGEPGHRTFFLEGWSGARHCTLVVEKVQVQELGRRLLQVLGETGEQRSAPEPRTTPEGSPGWRVGNIQVAIDESQPRCVLVVEELDLTEVGDEVEADDDEPAAADETGASDDPGVLGGDQDADPLRTARFVADLGQVRGLATRALEIIEGGRPVCPLCQRPIDPAGHVCPASNGHLHG